MFRPNGHQIRVLLRNMRYMNFMEIQTVCIEKQDRQPAGWLVEFQLHLKGECIFYSIFESKMSLIWIWSPFAAAFIKPLRIKGLHSAWSKLPDS